jgi:hypothetical protein
MAVLLLVGLTWLFYKLTIFLEPKGDQRTHAEASSDAVAGRRKLIHQRLRK